MQSAEDGPPSKKPRTADADAEEKNRLDNLVIQKCVSFLKQTISRDFKHEAVSKEFADAIRKRHGKMSISLDFMRQRANSWMLSENCQKSLMISVSRKDANDRPANIKSSEINIQLKDENVDQLKSILTKISSSFKEIIKVEMFPQLGLHPGYAKDLLKIYTAFVQTPNLLEIRRLVLYRLHGEDVFILLIEKLSPYLEELFFYGDAQDFDDESSSKKCFAAVAQCRNLKTLHIHSTYGENTLQYLFACLEVLQIETFSGGEPGEFSNSPDNANQLFRALKKNEKLSKLYLAEPASFYCSANCLPLLSQLRSVSIENDLTENGNADDEKSHILKILQTLRADGYLRAFTAERCLESGEVEDESQYHLDQSLHALKIMLKLSNSTRKPIRIQLYVGPNDEELNLETVFKMLTQEDGFNDVIISRRSSRRAQLRLKNARVTVTV